MRKKEKYSILKFKKGQKFFSASILFSYLWVLLFPLSILYSQPVNVPNFNAPQLSNQNFNQYVDLANESHSIDAWNTIVNQGFGVLKGTWENLANQEIAALEANVNTQYASDPATAAYINKMIESQASQSEQAWLTQIETQVADDQNSFLLSLQNSNLPSNAVTDSNFQGSLNKGLQNFSDSLTSLQQNYQNQLASINQTDAQYQQNIQQLQNYENAVRSNIQTAVNQLASSLQNTALFYNTNADGSVNWSSMNQSGTDLQTLISNLDQGLQNGTSLSTLASQMTAYLQQQETQATQNSNYWTQQSLPHSLTNSNSAVGFADYQLNNFQDVVNYANSVRSANSAINAIMTYIDGGKNSQDATLLSYLYSTYGYDPTKTQIVGISRADFVGTSTGYNNNYTPFPVTLWHSGDGLSYSTSGLNAFDFSATGLWAFGVFLPVTAYFTEDKLTYSIDFQIKDLTAGANAQAWNGFASNLNSELGTWNTLSPSISNWEGQMSAYQAQYAAWHAQAVAYEAQLQTSYSDGVANLDTQKQSWLASLSSQTSTSSGETHRGDDDDESRHVQIQIPNISNISLPNSSAVLNADTTAPNVDTSSLNNVLTVFQQSLIGAGNVALESRLNEQAITTKQNAVNQIASSLGKNAVVDSYGNITYTTAIEDGHAKLKAGGDATNSSDYEATKTNQNVYIGAPSTIKIASGGNLFQNWDTNSVLTENRTNEDSFHKSYNTAIKTLNTQINSLNAQNAKNDLAFQAAAQSAASYASDVQSLAKAMLQGGTFESWAKGQIQDKVNAAMATAIANATGMSPDMASQLVSWFEKKQADKKAKAKARTQEITSGLVTVASIAASFIAGPEMMAVGQAALQAVQGYQNGGMEGALVGAASGAATGYARQFGVNVSVSYSYSGGFGGSVGLGSSSLNAGVSFSQHGSSSFNIGGTYGNVSYNPTSGFSGSVNLTPGQNTGAMVNLGQHSGPSLTIQESDGSSGVGGSVTIDGKGNTTVAATYRNATVVSATGNVHNPSSFGNLSVNDNFNSDLNQNLAMGKADENLTAGRAELEAGRNAIAETGNEPQKEILNNENASVADQHGVLATLAKAGEFLTDPSSASTWLGRTTQDVVGSFLGSTGLGASDSNGFIDKNGKYVQRTCFTAGTLIRTKEGLKPIEKIEIGDYVLSLDPKTGELSYKKVLRLFSNETPIVHRITYTNGNVINTTWNHPFFIRGKGFTEVRNIQPEERSVTVASIRNSYRIERGSGIQIGASLASLGSRSTNSNSATWKDEIRGTVGIAKIEEVYEKTKVYNFEVEENHTYFVGKDGVLVHNSGGCMAGGFATGVGKSIARLVDAPQHLIETGASIAAPDNFRVTDEFGRPVSAHPLEAPLSKGAASTLYDKLVTEPGAEKAANSTCPDCSKDYSTGYKWGNFIGDGMLLVAGGLTALRGKLGGLGGKAGAAEERAVVRKAGAANSEKFKGLGDATTSPWLKDTRPGVAEHIGKFRDGGSFVMTESQYKAFYEANKSGKYGRPNGQFMTTRETIDQVTRGGQVDISTLNKKLGTDFKPGDKLVRVDINNPLLHNARLPAGVGPGANSQFRWGGYTSGGAPEIVIDQFKKGQFSSSKLY